MSFVDIFCGVVGFFDELIYGEGDTPGGSFLYLFVSITFFVIYLFPINQREKIN